MSLDALVNQSVSSILKSDDLKKYVDDAVTKAVQDSIQKAVSYNSNFQKQLKEKVEECLPIVDVTDLAVFSNAVREIIQHRLGNLANETAAEHIGVMLEKLLPESKEITFEELREEFKQLCAEEQNKEDYYDDDEFEPDYCIEFDKSSVLNRYWHLTFKPSERESNWSSKSVRLALRELEDKPGHHEVYAVNNEELSNKSLYAGPLYGFSALIFRLATQMAVLVVDRNTLQKTYRD